MPHSLFLGSSLATQDRISFRAPQDTGSNNTVGKGETDDSLKNQPSERVSHLRRFYGKFKKSILDAFLKPHASMFCHGERQNNSFEFVRAHIYYGMFDMVGSLIGFAVMINSLYVFFFFLKSFSFVLRVIFQDFDVGFCCILLWQW